jgi:hypothetical protein
VPDKAGRLKYYNFIDENIRDIKIIVERHKKEANNAT